MTIVEINNYRKDNDAIDIIYKKLQGDKIEVDISDIIKELHTIVDEAITPAAQSIYDILGN